MEINIGDTELVNDKYHLKDICEYVLELNPDKVNNYRLGKTALIDLYVGEVMKRSNNNFDPKEVLDTLINLLK